MTAGAKLIALMFEFARMRVMAIGAFDVLVEHLALHERAIFIRFTQELAIVVIALTIQQLQRAIVMQRLTGT